MTYLRRLAAGALVAVLVALPGVPAMAVNDGAVPEQSRVIVQAPGAEAHAAQVVQRLGGAVTQRLPIVSGFAATVPAAAVDELAAVPGIHAVTPDATMHPAKAPRPPSTSVQSVYRTEIGADALAKRKYTGKGVRVALVDTGIDTTVATSGDLKDRVVGVDDPTIAPTLLQPDPPDVRCINFSGEATCDDTFGHGTFLAGLIAGSGKASGGRYAGVATGAQIVSIKVGGADGSADVSKVLAGIQWVVSFADRYDIRVLNLSLGTDSTVSPSVDPLNLAVQRAWVEGITVVVSAGNFGAGPRTRSDGSSYGTVTKPGDDPFVVTVGSVDDLRTTTIADDRLPAFSSWGPTFHGIAKPDVVAPGARLVSLRAPGSTVDELPGTIDATYRTASGTSMSAAVTSGLVAQLLHARPQWRPDDVKAALTAGARPAASTELDAVGAGLVYGPSALEATINPTYRTSVVSSGSGSLLDTSGTNLVTLSCESLLSLCGVEDGLTSQGSVWNGTEYALTSWSPQSWYESQWVVGIAGHNWQTSTWAGHNWQGHNWQGYYGEPNNGPSYGEPIDGSGSYGVWGG